MGLFTWLAETLEGPGPGREPLPGETFRFENTGQEVLIVAVQPRDTYHGPPGGRQIDLEVRAACVKYKTEDGQQFEAPYQSFFRAGQVVPKYNPSDSDTSNGASMPSDLDDGPDDDVLWLLGWDFSLRCLLLGHRWFRRDGAVTAWVGWDRATEVEGPIDTCSCCGKVSYSVSPAPRMS